MAAEHEDCYPVNAPDMPRLGVTCKFMPKPQMGVPAMQRLEMRPALGQFLPAVVRNEGHESGGPPRFKFPLLETDDEHFYSEKIRDFATHWATHAWALPDEVWKKVYGDNALRVLSWVGLNPSR